MILTVLRSTGQVFYRKSLNPDLEEEGQRGDVPLSSFSGALTTGDVNLGDPTELVFAWFLHGSTSLQPLSVFFSRKQVPKCSPHSGGEELSLPS